MEEGCVFILSRLWSLQFAALSCWWVICVSFVQIPSNTARIERGRRARQIWPDVRFPWLLHRLPPIVPRPADHCHTLQIRRPPPALAAAAPSPNSPRCAAAALGIDHRFNTVAYLAYRTPFRAPTPFPRHISPRIAYSNTTSMPVSRSTQPIRWAQGSGKQCSDSRPQGGSQTFDITALDV